MIMSDVHIGEPKPSVELKRRVKEQQPILDVFVGCGGRNEVTKDGLKEF
jgi:hypothetical protein